MKLCVERRVIAGVNGGVGFSARLLVADTSSWRVHLARTSVSVSVLRIRIRSPELIIRNYLILSLVALCTEMNDEFMMDGQHHYGRYTSNSCPECSSSR